MSKYIWDYNGTPQVSQYPNHKPNLRTCLASADKRSTLSAASRDSNNYGLDRLSMTTRQLERLKAHNMIYRQEVTPLHSEGGRTKTQVSHDSKDTLESIVEDQRLNLSPEPMSLRANLNFILRAKPSTTAN